MIIPIVYPSALQFWMDSNLLDNADEFRYDRRVPALLPGKYQFLPRAELGMTLARQYGFTMPISVLAPEFCFLEAAMDLSLLELIKLGFDLCAIYLPDASADYNQVGRKAITTRLTISEYLDTAPGLKGINKAKRAISYVLDNSNSPMETMVAMLMILPMHMGGYGIIKPELNRKVYLSDQGSRLLERNYCICDAVWGLQKVILEYDSNLTHLSPEQHRLDKARLSALTLSGYHVVSITADNFRNLSAIDNTFTALRWKLGQRKELKHLNKYSEERRALLQFFKSQQSNSMISTLL